MKLVAIGIGSAIFGVNLLRDLFRTPELRGCEMWLVDTDRAAVERMAVFARRLDQVADWGVRIEAVVDRTDALEEADFVVSSAAIDRIRTWRIDHELALRHGFPSVLSENGGPGGLSHTLRSVPLMLEIAHDIERLAPSAVLFNYTNPENRVCLALHRFSAVRTVGLCHSVGEAIDRCVAVLGRDHSELDVQAAGVNHFTWFVAIRDREGIDLLPEFRRRWADGVGSTGVLTQTLFDTFGVVPAIDDDHVGEFLPWAADLIGTAGYDFEAHERNAVDALHRLDAYAAGEEPVEPLLAEPSVEALVGNSIAEIIADLAAGRARRRPSFILPNTGLIDGLPSDSIVEVPGIVEDGQPRGLPVGALPGPITGLVRHELAVQELAVEAAVQGSRDLALRALLLDPIVGSARAAGQYLDEVLSTQRQFLPRFWK